MKKILLLSALFFLLGLSGCTKMSQKIGLNFDKRFTIDNHNLIAPPFLDNDYAIYSNLEN